MRMTFGAVLGSYQISGPIGAGGMGEVYRARDTRLGREVAIKVLPREVTTDPERLARFEREARGSSALNHPNIVTIHEFGRDGENHYLVMELIRGESLRALLSRGPVPQKKLFALAAGIADGLAAAHAAGLVHRDLKPENVMITADGTPKILDFGLVKTTTTSGEMDTATEMKVTNTGMIVGTVTYMSPEQARGGAVGIESDQFALGLILHEMASGRHPFGRSNPYETVTAILNEEPPPLDGFPEWFAWTVERCLAKGPAERYASTSDLARDLRTLRDRVGSTSNKAQAVPPAGARRSTRWFAVAAAVIALAALFALASAFLSRPETTAIAAPLQLDLATPEIDVATAEVVVPLALSPDGRRLVVLGAGARGASELWLHDLTTREAKMIAENAFGAAWSDDGRAIAFFADGKLKTVPAAGGPATTVCDASPEGTPTWFGDTILFVRYSGGPAVAGMYRVSAAGGVPQRIVPMQATADRVRLPWSPTFLPGGRRFLYIELENFREKQTIDHHLMLGSLDGTPPVRIAAISSRAVYASGYLLFVREGTLMAQQFDVDRGRLIGEPKPLISDLHYFRNTAMAAFSASENGVLAWRSSRRPHRLAWVDRTGVELGTVATALFDIDGRLSADGARYAAGVIDPRTGTSDVWVYDLVRESAERMTSTPHDQKAPVWAEDGQSMYHRSDGNSGPPDIFLLRRGSETRTVIHSGPAVEHPEDVSPDGKTLLFTTLTHITSDIYALPLDPPGPPRPFAVRPFNETHPRFSPDGRWIVYSSDVSGRAEVYVRTADSTGAATRISRDGGVRPVWSREGSEIFFLGPEGRVMSVAFAEKTGPPQMLFQNASAISVEPAPDGTRFLMHLDERRGETALHVLINWPERLRQSIIR